MIEPEIIISDLNTVFMQKITNLIESVTNPTYLICW